MRENDIDVCIATYKRPHLLTRLLESLALQEPRGTHQIRVVVIDNDREGSAKRAVDTFRSTHALEVVYEIEPAQGISYARNRALQHVTSRFASFLDDDEEASPGWLQNMLRAAQTYEADIVFGPVIGVLPSTAPAWARSHPCFVRQRHQSGEEVGTGASGNVLFRAAALQGMAEPFDNAYSHTGGEDSDLFHRLHRSGNRMVWCDEAEVFEEVPPERTTLGWVSRRAFRGGQTYFRIVLADFGILRRCAWLAARLSAAVAVAVTLPILWLLNHSRFVRDLTRLCGWAGQLSMITGGRFVYHEYSAARYRSEIAANEAADEI